MSEDDAMCPGLLPWLRRDDMTEQEDAHCCKGTERSSHEICTIVRYRTLSELLGKNNSNKPTAAIASEMNKNDNTESRFDCLFLRGKNGISLCSLGSLVSGCDPKRCCDQCSASTESRCRAGSSCCVLSAGSVLSRPSSDSRFPRKPCRWYVVVYRFLSLQILIVER
jgi:hypothetical protein